METFILYLFKSAICLSVFLITYVLFLRRMTFFRFNRFFLLAGFVASWIAPAIKCTYEVLVPATIMHMANASAIDNASVQQSGGMSIWTILFILYITGAAIVLARNVCLCIKLSRLIGSYGTTKLHGCRLVAGDKIESPFSILNFILINPNKLSLTEKDLIIKHETTHIRQKHWIDLLCSECMLLLQWFNPLAWLYVRLLKENHEFLADEAVVRSCISPAVYHAVIANQEFRSPVFSFTNSFSYSNPLIRLSMMKKAKSPSWKKLAALAIIPLFGLFFWVSATPHYIMEQPSDMNSRSMAISSDTLKGRIVYFNSDSVKSESSPLTVVYSKEDSTNVFTVKTVKAKTAISNALAVSSGADQKEPLIVIIDGDQTVEYLHKADVKLKDSSVDGIERIDILKGESAIALYGDRAKDGIVIIKMKNAAQKESTVTESNTIKVDISNEDGVQFQGFEPSGALLIIDGKRQPSEVIKQLKADDIAYMNVYKGKPATDKYGEDGKNGVMEVVTKKVEAEK